MYHDYQLVERGLFHRVKLIQGKLYTILNDKDLNFAIEKFKSKRLNIL